MKEIEIATKIVAVTQGIEIEIESGKYLNFYFPLKLHLWFTIILGIQAGVTVTIVKGTKIWKKTGMMTRKTGTETEIAETERVIEIEIVIVIVIGIALEGTVLERKIDRTEVIAIGTKTRKDTEEIEKGKEIERSPLAEVEGAVVALTRTESVTLLEIETGSEI